MSQKRPEESDRERGVCGEDPPVEEVRAYEEGIRWLCDHLPFIFDGCRPETLRPESYPEQRFIADLLDRTTHRH